MNNQTKNILAVIFFMALHIFAGTYYDNQWNATTGLTAMVFLVFFIRLINRKY